ncbi:NADH-quinone oxidoreductase subunit C [candidate division FCPU426 bacterium]|nr:NADH-quinone oxidoreductase subunit C [candidate division FCPU426 bacterium]
MNAPAPLSDQLQGAFPQAAVTPAAAFGPELTLAAGMEAAAVCAQLKSNAAFAFDILEDYTALDQGETFLLVLHLTASAEPLRRMTVKFSVAGTDAVVPTLSRLYGSAEWYEREIYDMFGIRFSGHPDLRRILLPEDWQGHPLRKDYQDPRMLRRPEE